jgi:predicted acylesterase/phospholipase RssA/CRP-like cAMP-binding protein
MAQNPALARTPLLADLPDEALDALTERMQQRRFEAGETLCTAGESSDRIWVITAGLVHWLAPTTGRAGDIELRLRKGDVIGAQDAITGEERSATVVAALPTSTLELSASDLIDIAQQHPQLLLNVIRSQRERLSRASAQSVAEQRGEEVGVAAGPSMRPVIGLAVAAARAATPRPVTFLDRRLSFAGALTASDQLAARHATVLIPAELDPASLAVLLDEVDRVVVLVGTGAEAEALAPLCTASSRGRLEVILVGDEAVRASKSWPAGSEELVVRICEPEPITLLADDDVAWLARHLTRTKLGLALGAGGAKGYAHVGALQVIEENGYTIDYVGGSSIGGFVASHIGLGYNAQAIDGRFRRAFNPDAVSTLFSTPFGGGSAGLDALTALLKEATEERSFSDALIPLVIMAVDLTDRAPAPLRSGPLWEALLAALAVAGVFPPQERDGHRLVDGLALVPVPTASVIEDGADLVVSVNLMGAESLEHWPSRSDVDITPPKPRRRGPIDTLLEVMDLSQLDTSTRHAGLADVVVTPRFAPSDWRDFHLADLFLAAGREAALEQLPTLQARSRPIDLASVRRETAIVTLA